MYLYSPDSVSLFVSLLLFLFVLFFTVFYPPICFGANFIPSCCRCCCCCLSLSLIIIVHISCVVCCPQQEVIKQRNTSSMSPPLILANWLSAAVWSAYGIVINDIFIIVGAVLSCAVHLYSDAAKKRLASEAEI